VTLGAGGGTISVDGTLTLDGIVGGAGRLTKTGPGNLLLAGNNSAYSAGITISGGQIQFAADNNLGTTTQQITLNGGTLEYTNTAKYVLADVSTHTVAVTAAGGGLSVTSGAPDDNGGMWFSVANALSGSGPLVKSGAGTLRMTAVNSTLTSPWTITDGMVESGGLNMLGSGSVTVTGGTLVSRNTPFSNPVILNGGAIGTRSGDLTDYTGPVTILGNSSVRLYSFTTQTSPQTVIISGKVSGSGTLSAVVASNTAASTKSLTLTNPSNDFSGIFDISPGQTLLAQAAAGVGKTLGTSTVQLKNSTVKIRDNGTGNSGNLTYGNNISVLSLLNALDEPIVSTSVIDVDRVAANTGNVIKLGGLNVEGHSTPVLTTVNFVTANSYSVAFDGESTINGNVSLTSAGFDLKFNGPVNGSGNITFSGAGRAMQVSSPLGSPSGTWTFPSSTTLLSTPTTFGSPLGTATISLSSATARIRDNGTANNQNLPYGNNFVLGAGSSTIEVSRVSGANTGSTIAMGGLSMSSSTMIVTTGASYKLAFDGPVALAGSSDTISNTAEVILNGSISGTANLTKSGAARLALNGDSSAYGATLTVSAGTLGGDGVFGGNVAVSSGATIAPGNGTGVLSIVKNLTLNSGANFTPELGRGSSGQPIPGEYDQLKIGTGVGATSTGAVSLNGSNLNPVVPGGLFLNDIFFLIVNDGADAVTGTFTGKAQGSQFTQNGYTFTISYNADFGTNSMSGGNDVAIMIPEPSGAMVLLGGLVTVAARRRRRE
jgi:autotransporter-associated beta strand protein